MPTERLPPRVPSYGWNAINCVSTAPATPDPTGFQVEPSESPLANTPQDVIPRSPASGGIKRTGEWLESMAKRRKAAQETTKRASQSLEPLKTQMSRMPSSSRSLPSAILPPSRRKTPQPVRETRVVPNVITRSRQARSITDVHHPNKCRTVQVVLPARRECDLSTRSDPVNRVLFIPEKSMGSALTILPASQNGPSCFSTAAEIIEISDSESWGSSADGSSQNEGELYEVEGILEERTGTDAHEFLVRWVGQEKPSWILAEDCFCQDLITSFRAAQSAKIAGQYLNEQQPATSREQSKGQRSYQTGSNHSVLLVNGSQQHREEPKRDSKIGRFLKTGKRETRRLKSQGPDETELIEEDLTVLQKVKFNTARFSLRSTTPFFVDTRRDPVTGQILFLRTKAGDNALSTSRAAETGARETRGNGDNSPNPDAHHQDMRKLKVVEAKVTRWKKARDPETFDNSQHQNRTALKESTLGESQLSLPTNELAGLQQGENPLPQMSEARRPPPTTQRLPIHIRFNDPEPIAANPPARIPLNSKSFNSCDEVLRRARRQEKIDSGRNLLRHEFTSSMSYKRAEALINHTRASPERAFGFCLTSNTVLPSVEKDED